MYSLESRYSIAAIESKLLTLPRTQQNSPDGFGGIASLEYTFIPPSELVGLSIPFVVIKTTNGVGLTNYQPDSETLVIVEPSVKDLGIVGNTQSYFALGSYTLSAYGSSTIGAVVYGKVPKAKLVYSFPRYNEDQEVDTTLELLWLEKQ